ncbi:MAG: hypothetical protein FJY73_14330 [Candidatus Eisenbacteria bacterium]|nr:hypothetical protein [Candidatus Eisenbacteria bacterium]
MKKVGAGKKRDRVSEDLRPEYRFDYSKARRNRFASRAAKGPLVVVLDDEIARVFPTAESVKAVLRAIVSAMPPRGGRA